MKQKIVVKLQHNCEGCRCKVRKVIKTLTFRHGVRVTSGTLEGNCTDQLAVVVDGIDSVKLTTALSKKVGKAAEIISVEEVHENTEKDEEGGGEKKDKGGGGKGGGGSEKKDKPDDSEKKDKEGGGRSGEKNDKANGELRKMGANKVYGSWFMFGPGTCAEAVLDEPKQGKWLLTVVH